MRDAIWNFVISPEFIVGGLVVGFIVNILASYMKERIDRQLAQYSASRREKNEVLTERRRVAIARMVSSDDELAQMRHMESRQTAIMQICALGAFSQLILAAFLLSLPVIAPDRVTKLTGFLLAAVPYGLNLYFGAKLFALYRSNRMLWQDIRSATHYRQDQVFILGPDGTLIPKPAADSQPQISQFSPQQ